MAQNIDYTDPYELVIVGLDTPDREENPLFDERVFAPVDEALVKNITVYGVLLPVTVKYENGKTYVVDGRQRVRAARAVVKLQREAGEHSLKVPCLTREGDDARMTGIMISTNEHRQGDEILTKAKKAARLLSQVGDINEVAVAFGRSVLTLQKWFQLLKAAPEVHDAVRSGALSTSAAIELSSLERSDQLTRLKAITEPEATAGVAETAEGIAKPKRARPVSAAQIKRAKKEDGEIKAQKGVNRSWVRQALKSKAAANLAPSQRNVLSWFANGEEIEGSWFTDFARQVKLEIELSEADQNDTKAPETNNDSTSSEQADVGDSQ